jgi:hypothetical protein
MDILLLLVALSFFGASVWLIHGCERLRQPS